MTCWVKGLRTELGANGYVRSAAFPVSIPSSSPRPATSLSQPPNGDNDRTIPSTSRSRRARGAGSAPPGLPTAARSRAAGHAVTGLAGHFPSARTALPSSRAATPGPEAAAAATTHGTRRSRTPGATPQNLLPAGRTGPTARPKLATPLRPDLPSPATARLGPHHGGRSTSEVPAPALWPRGPRAREAGRSEVKGCRQRVREATLGMRVTAVPRAEPRRDAHGRGGPEGGACLGGACLRVREGNLGVGEGNGGAQSLAGPPAAHAGRGAVSSLDLTKIFRTKTLCKIN